MRIQPSYLFLVLSMVSVFTFNPQGAAAQPLDLGAIDRFIAAQMAAQRVPGLAL